MEWITAQQAAAKWNTSVRSVQNLCREGRVAGAERWGRTWMIPAETEKPADKRMRRTEETGPVHQMLEIPRQCPPLILTDLYYRAGCADECIASMDNPYAVTLMQAWLSYSKGEIQRAVELAKSLLSVKSDLCGQLSIGVLMTACSLWLGDLSLWTEGRALIQKVPCSSKYEQVLLQMSLATADEGLFDNSQLPEWFQKGRFDYLPADSLSAAWYYYSKYLYIFARNLTTGRTKLKEIEGFDLLRTLPYLIEPLIAQSRAARAAFAELCMRGLCAKIYYDLGEQENAVRHLDEALHIALPDKLYGVLAELRIMLNTFLDERVERLNPTAAKEIRELHKHMLNGFSKMMQSLRNVQFAATLSDREQEVAQLAAMGLSNSEIAKRLHISASSVKSIIAMIMNKTSVQKRSEFPQYTL